METYSVEILHPKATKLLQDLADLELIIFKPTGPSVNMADEEERAKARERIMRGGSQTLDVEEMLAHVKETRERKLPFWDE
ncbi:hypothetical protein GCM10027341_10100 [Spirosoma knui]